MPPTAKPGVVATRLLASSIAVLVLACTGASRAADTHNHHHHHHHAHDQQQAPAAAAPADDPHAAHHAAMKPAVGESTRVNLSDAPLLTQDGIPVRFKSDVLGDQVVVIDFVYTTCTTICPVQSAMFSALQERLGERLGRSVKLVSLTVDPARDTPARLKEAAQKYGSGPAWTWLTGTRPAVEEVLRAFGAYTPNFTDHPPLLLVGDASSGRWTRFYGFADPERILATVEQALAARNTAKTALVQ